MASGKHSHPGPVPPPLLEIYGPCGIADFVSNAIDSLVCRYIPYATRMHTYARIHICIHTYTYTHTYTHTHIHT